MDNNEFEKILKEIKEEEITPSMYLINSTKNICRRKDNTDSLIIAPIIIGVIFTLISLFLLIKDFSVLNLIIIYLINTSVTSISLFFIFTFKREIIFFFNRKVFSNKL
ncbi:hypothetical protein [Dethiothermospora halolimnae]|uniref:hypothetical protein n=1 Tax=Dethiothermospora halolimnae TaxID=3114390 RepID=UPI003CCBC045